MSLWDLYRGLSVIVFTSWLASVLLAGPIPSIKAIHWIHESVRASWWIKNDIDRNFERDFKGYSDQLGSLTTVKPANADHLEGE